MDLMSAEMWFLIQLFIDLILLAVILIFFKNIRSSLGHEADPPETATVIERIESFVTSAHESADAFDALIREKQGIIRDLNLKLDDRISRLQQMLDRSEKRMVSLQQMPSPLISETLESYDAKTDILRLSEQGLSAKIIAARLDVPLGEVELVLNLKQSDL